MTDNEWYNLLSKTKRREVEGLQWELTEQGFGDNTDFRMKSCWIEAVKRLRQKYPVPDFEMQNMEENEGKLPKEKVKPKKFTAARNQMAAKEEPELVDFS